MGGWARSSALSARLLVPRPAPSACPCIVPCPPPTTCLSPAHELPVPGTYTQHPAPPSYTAAQVTCPDRHGLLSDVVRALRELPLEITTAAITTRRDHVVYDVFQVGWHGVAIRFRDAPEQHAKCGDVAWQMRGTTRARHRELACPALPHEAGSSGQGTRLSPPATCPRRVPQVEVQDECLTAVELRAAVEAALCTPGDTKKRKQDCQGGLGGQLLLG